MKYRHLRSAWVGLLAVMMVLTLGGCSKSGMHTQSAYHQTGRSEVREAPTNTTAQKTPNNVIQPLDVGYSEQKRTEYMNGCRSACTNKDKSQEKAAYCELYCDCTHANLRMKVSSADLQAFSQGKKTTSSQTIEGIRHQCQKDADTALTGSTPQKHS